MEARIGELLPPSEEMSRLAGKKLRGITYRKGSDGKKTRESVKILPEGINSLKAYQARTIARHPEAVAEVIQEAEENEDIPTKPSPATRRP